MTERRFTHDDDKWQAVASRDATADGAFLYAVQTTGVYCRPACPSRRPLRANVSFFATGAHAQQAGFRACRRCEPDGVTAEQQAVAVVRRLLDEAERPLPLAALGQATGYSPTHLQKLFKRATGLSPRQYAGAGRAQRLRDDLKVRATVTEAGYAAGYGSSRGLYESAQQTLGMPPGAYRRGGAGQKIRYACFESALGPVLLAATHTGLCALRFGDEVTVRAELLAEFPRAEVGPDTDGELATYVAATERLLAGSAWQPGLALDAWGTAFQQRVWAALRQIPRGQMRTYGEVAADIGRPTAVRAVANACGSNPLAVVTPCHRVVGAGGALGGYRWGVVRKQALLEMEADGANVASSNAIN